MNQIADDLDRAADLLDYELDWCQGHMFTMSDAGEVLAACADGAIILATTAEEDRNFARSMRSSRSDRAFDALARHLDLSVAGLNHLSITCWNDKRGRTKQQVVDGFRLAAKDERELWP